MTSSLRRAGARALGITVLAVVSVLGFTSTAGAATQSVTYQLQASAAGQTGTASLSVNVGASAPASVAAGGSVTDTLTTGSFTVPTSVKGYTISQIKDFVLTVPVPANSTFGSCALSGGSNLGSGTPSCSQSGGKVNVSVPGPIPGGTKVTPPQLTLKLTAGKSGSIAVKLAGTSFNDPGLTFTAVVSVLGAPVNASVVGYPNPSPVLATTTIG